MPHARWASAVIPSGATFTVNQVADNGGGAPRFRTTAAHGMAVNDVVRNAGFTDPAYNGVFTVTAVSDGTHYDVAAVFTANDSGTVTVGTAKTAAVNIGFGERIVALHLPSVWRAAADVVFQISRDGTNYLDLMDKAGAIIRVTTVAVSEMRALANDSNAMDFPVGDHKVRLRACNTATAVDVLEIDTPEFFLLLAKDR